MVTGFIGKCASEFSFDAGLPITLSPITDKDRKYTASNVPTIFGENLPTYNYNANIPCSTSPFCHEISGNETLNSLGLFSYPIAQAAVSYYHARVVLRGMWLPAISELKAFSLLDLVFNIALVIYSSTPYLKNFKP